MHANRHGNPCSQRLQRPPNWMHRLCNNNTPTGSHLPRASEQHPHARTSSAASTAAIVESLRVMMALSAAAPGRYPRLKATTLATPEPTTWRGRRQHVFKEAWADEGTYD